MVRLPIPGQDESTWGDILNEYLLVAHDTDGNIKPGIINSGNIQNASIGDLQISSIAHSKITGLGTAATKDTPDTGDATANEVVNGSDTRLSNVRTPSAHANTHASAGSDPVTLAQSQITGLATALSSKASSGVNSDITSLSGLSTPLAVAQGGTGSGSAQAAINTLSNVSSATNEHVLTKDTASGNAIFKPATTIPNANEQTFTVTSTLATSTGGPRWYSPYAMTINDVRASVGTAPTGASVIVDVNKNGSTIFTTQSNRPTITAGNNTDLADAINVSAVATGDYLTVDIDQVGSTTPGADLTVTFRYTVS